MSHTSRMKNSHRVAKLSRAIAFLILASFSLGFRVYPGDVRWTISADDPVIWIRMCERPAYDSNDLPAGDPLADQAITFNSLLTSIKDDYSNVQTSFIQLKDTGVDTGFDAATDRVIDICYGQIILASGYARQRVENEHVMGCDIRLADKIKSSAKSLVTTLTHEIGHCMGLDHTQDLSYAIMSYFKAKDIVRLQVDDKMGLTYLYPQDPEYGQEKVTLGMSCN